MREKISENFGNPFRGYRSLGFTRAAQEQKILQERCGKGAESFLELQEGAQVESIVPMRFKDLGKI